MSSKFPWGQVIDTFTFDFDGNVMEVTKYHPYDYNVRKAVKVDIIEYHCQELAMSYNNLFALIIAYIAYKQLGLNQHALVAGFARALELK